MFMGCHTTIDAEYNIQEIETKYTLDNAVVVSHQNKMGVLYYTVVPIYINSITGEQLSFSELDRKEQDRFITLTNWDFPFSTYSDAVLYKEKSLPSEIIIKEKKKELVKPEEEVFSPVKTGLAIGLPILGLLTVILSMLVGSPDTSNNNEK
jgi:hypothetical protein